jgi:hypothetical protein
MQYPTHTGEHTHEHGQQCGHVAVIHNGHVDYLHDGHLHFRQGDQYEEHVISVDETNPAICQPLACTCDHQAAGDERVPHGDHVDYLSQGRLHHHHGSHCDDHGLLATR